jgi:hypothetical protein
MVMRHELRAVWPPSGAGNLHLDDRSVDAWRPNPTRRRRPRVGPDLTRPEAHAADPTRPAQKARGFQSLFRAAATDDPTIRSDER